MSPRHFYWPIPDTSALKKHDFTSRFSLDGIDINLKKALYYLDKIHEYKPEYDKVKTNSGYESNGDGAILYGMLRELQPSKMIEVGSGFSTRISYLAMQKNKKGKIIAIEPYPKDVLKKLAAKNKVRLINKKIEELDVSFFKQLNQGDVLFIDTSHVIKCGNDVHFLYLKVLPQVPKGTFIHIHDIRFPEEYPREWLLKNKHFWNEQYLLHMFLCFNESFEVVFPSNYMKIKYPNKCKNIFELEDKSGWPGSFWFKRIK